MLKKLKLRGKLLIMLLSISLITTCILGTIAFVIGKNDLEKESFKKLTAIREMKANQIENYFQQIFDQVNSFSENRMVIEAVNDFKNGFNNVVEELNYTTFELERIDSVLYSYYHTQYLNQLFYRDSTLNYFSIPKEELLKNQQLWLAKAVNKNTISDSLPNFLKISPSNFKGNLKMGGSSTTSSLVAHMLKLFKEEGAQGNVSYQSTSSLDGIKSLIDETGIDIAGLSHELNEQEIKLFNDANLSPLSFRIGTDAIVVVAGNGNTFLTSLSSEELRLAFTTAKLWSDINPEWPDEIINRFIPSEGSGSHTIFLDVILSGNDDALQNVPNTTFIKDGEYMKEQMKSDPFAIAFFSYNYYDSESLLKIVDVDGFELNDGNISNGNYPLTRPLFITTTTRKLKANKNIAIVLNYFLNAIGKEVGTSLSDIEYWPQHYNRRVLQYQYIADNPNQKGEKDDLVSLSESTSYNETHKLYHSIFKNYLDRFGYYDVFVIDADGNIVYSVKKEMDFATDLIHGPYSTTNLSHVFKQAIESDNPTFISFEDFKPYLPSYNAPASFIASPIFDGDQKIGVLAFQLPVSKINDIMTDGYQWEEVGLGNSGETYLVGTDYLMRNQSRFLIEDAEKYFISLEKMSLQQEVVSKIKALNTTIGLQPVRTEGTMAALNGETNTKIFQDYRGVEVMSAYKPLNIDLIDWVIMSEIDKSEAYAAIPILIKNFLYWSILLIVIILLLANYFSRSISRPVQLLSERASDLAEGNLDSPVIIKQNDEIGLLAGNFEKMRFSIKKLIGDLQDINQNLEKRVEQRTEELSVANRQIQGIVDSLLDSLVIIDEQGIIVSCSPSTKLMFQYSEEELIGKNINILMPSPYHEEHDGYLEKYRNSGIKNILGQERELLAKRKDGQIFPVRLLVNQVKTTNRRIFVGLLSDLTERKKNELRLKSQSAALKSAGNGIVITNSTGVVTWVNPAFTKLTGYEWREVVGKTPSVLKSGKHDKQFYSKMWKTITDGEVWHGEIINKKKNGDLFYEEMTITPIRNEKEEIVQFVAIKNDISERKRLEEIMVKAKERMEDELNVAKEIQMSMLPLIFPAFPKREEIEIYAELIPAREVGGDFYDFYFLDENHICFVMGDVSGKGVPAALMMAVTKTLLKSRAGNDKSTASILTHVNNEIAKDNDAYMFITVFIAILNTNTGELLYSNAGHNPSYVISKENRAITKLGDLHGPVVGAMEDMTYGETKLFLKKNDIVLSYTDGVTESQNINEELYSDARFEELLEKGKYHSSKTLTNLIIKSVKEFEGDAEQFDDITVMATEYCQNPNTVSIIKSSLRIENDLKQITTAIDWFEEFASMNEMPMAITLKFNIAFDELLNNIISYGYDDTDVHEIEIEIELRDERLIIVISDDGIPFNPFKKIPPDTMLSVEEKSIGGLGIHIVKNLMDECHYKRNVNNNIITLIKDNINNT
jgi:sigma-B regulation protein RsbU (phosphoserine phosphatase)